MNTLKTCVVLIVVGLFMLLMKNTDRPAGGHRSRGE